MGKLIDSLVAYSGILQGQFNQIRATNSHPGIKGGGNEDALAEFLGRHVAAHSIAKRCQVIDSQDNLSDEMDICLCNEHQFFQAPSQSLLIVEGVDVAVQVKAKLDSRELEKAKANCRSLKSLRRAPPARNTFASNYSVCPKTGEPSTNRVPFMLFAYSSDLSPKTIHEQLQDDSHPLEQMDAVFVLDRGATFINCRHGSSWGSSDGRRVIGWLALDTASHTLPAILRFIHSAPRLRWTSSPSVVYFSALEHDSIVEPQFSSEPQQQ